MEILPGVGGSTGCSCDVLRWIEQQPQHKLTLSHLDSSANFTTSAIVAADEAMISEMIPASSIIIRIINSFSKLVGLYLNKIAMGSLLRCLTLLVF
jgi:hypothetical protein